MSAPLVEEKATGGESGINVKVKRSKPRHKFILDWSKELPNENLEVPHPEDFKGFDLFLCDRWFKWRDDSPSPLPYPAQLSSPMILYVSRSDHTFVQLPLMPTDAKINDRPRNEVVEEALTTMTRGLRHLNHLHTIMETYLGTGPAQDTLVELEDEIPDILDQLMKIAELALRSKKLFTQKIPLMSDLDKEKRASIHMSQEQSASLLALAFFCCFSGIGGRQMNFFALHRLKYSGGKSLVKMRFMMTYFREVTDNMPNGTITFIRQKFSPDRFFDGWESERSPFLPLYSSDKGRIEGSRGCLQVDFANSCIGGGVLDKGCLQEEIRFLCCPELIVSKLLCTSLQDEEAILIYGAQQYSSFQGYGKTTQWCEYDGPEEERDMYGRARSYVVAIDALCFPSSAVRSQYRESLMIREVNKAYAGFQGYPKAGSPRRPVTTGNWGCGAFNGDRELKSLLQLVACAKAHRPMIYLTFGDKSFAKQLTNIHKELVDNKILNGELMRWLTMYEESNSSSVFAFILERIQLRHAPYSV